MKGKRYVQHPPFGISAASRPVHSVGTDYAATTDVFPGGIEADVIASIGARSYISAASIRIARLSETVLLLTEQKKGVGELGELVDIERTSLRGRCCKP